MCGRPHKQGEDLLQTGLTPLRPKRCYCGFVATYVSIFLCLVVGFRPRFHSGHLVPLKVSCLKKQTILRLLHWIFVLISWPFGNVQGRFMIPSQLTISHFHLPAKAWSAVLDAFYLLQLTSRKLSQMWADLLRSKDDADLNVRIEHRYASWAGAGQEEVSNKAINGCSYIIHMGAPAPCPWKTQHK